MTRKYELYEITSEVTLLEKFREEYIKSINGPVVSKVVSSHAGWYYYRDGIYDVDKMMKNAYFGLSLIPISGHSKLVEDFIVNGASNKLELKAVRYEGKEIFMYVPAYITKRGRNYETSPIIKINEDIYNIGKIIARDFSSITIDDLKRYRDYFNISESPYVVIDEARVEDLYRTGDLSREDYKKQLEKYELEERLVKTLRK